MLSDQRGNTLSKQSSGNPHSMTNPMLRTATGRDGTGSSNYNKSASQYSKNGRSGFNAVNRAAVVGGVSKSQQKSWKPLRDQGRLQAQGVLLNSDSRGVDNTSNNNFGRPPQSTGSRGNQYNSISNFNTTKNSRERTGQIRSMGRGGS